MFETFYSLSRAPFSRDMPTGGLYESVILEKTLDGLAQSRFPTICC
ncbi:hypothetical protein M5X11_22430 [Paenibacillus alginolyticus]|nr:hypothetical protein [Paenibacillus alginolyticus]MCY9667641.1 hypothetical protein [Paenibacillus alginolyticus]